MTLTRGATSPRPSRTQICPMSGAIEEHCGPYPLFPCSVARSVTRCALHFEPNQERWRLK